MKRNKNAQIRTDLPAPVSLTPEQLAAVASEASALLGSGGGLLPHIIYGGFPVAQMLTAVAVSAT